MSAATGPLTGRTVLVTGGSRHSTGATIDITGADYVR